MRYTAWLCLSLVGCTTMPEATVAPGTPTGGNSPLATHLPCDVQQILVTSCQSCHGTKPAGGAPMSLVTYADLTAPAPSDPSQTVAALSLVRITSSSAPMPPSPPLLAAADIATIRDWVMAGTPTGDCTSAPDPLNAQPTCTSARTWTGGNEGSSLMNPGLACIQCHSQNREAPRFTIAGTLYPTGHEPDRCDGSSTAQIVIIDAAGVTLTLTPNSAGNFSTRTGLTLPYSAKVVAGGRTRAMNGTQTSGDCNSCHTQAGANGAPGRITLPL